MTVCRIEGLWNLSCNSSEFECFIQVENKYQDVEVRRIYLKTKNQPKR
jgi:hypothetical protein